MPESKRICPNCGFTRGSVVRLPKGSKHYAAIKCAECDCFIEWIAKSGSQSGGVK